MAELELDFDLARGMRWRTTEPLVME